MGTISGWYVMTQTGRFSVLMITKMRLYFKNKLLFRLCGFHQNLKVVSTGNLIVRGYNISLWTIAGKAIKAMANHVQSGIEFSIQTSAWTLEPLELK
jgi:hypothetical protein